MTVPWLSLLTLLPLAGGGIVLALPRAAAGRARPVALGFQALVLLGVAAVFFQFDPGNGGIQLLERRAWVPALGVEYVLGVDGLGLVSVALAALVPALALAAGEPAAAGRERLFHALLLFLQSGLFGTFTALNFFHWFLYWELSLVPAYLLVRLFGGARSGPASFQFFVYTMVGSVALLLGFLALRAAGGSFDFLELAEFGRTGRLGTALAERVPWLGGGESGAGAGLALVVFAGVLLGFAVKVPLWPFHTWLPDTYTEAPTTVTLVLTGAMSKMGVYGILRILLPVFPDQVRQCQGVLVLLALATVILPALAAWVQSDFKRMLAYSSINHLGYCLLAAFALPPHGAGGPWREGLAAPALNGTLLQMFNHGLTAAALFAGVALLERRNREARELGRLGGLRQVAPVYCGLMGISLFASLGLPGLNGFVGEFLIFKGVFGSVPWAGALATLGLLATAVFLLSAMRRLFHGPLDLGEGGFPDLTPGERWLLGVPVALMFLFGVFPDLILRWTNPTVLRWAGGP